MKNKIAALTLSLLASFFLVLLSLEAVAIPSSSLATNVAIVPMKIETSSGSSFIIDNQGILWAFGENSFGQLGDGTTVDRNSPVKIMESVSSVSTNSQTTFAVKTDGTLWSWGRNSDGILIDGTTIDQLTPTKVLTGVADVSVGGSHVLILKTDATLYSFGWNYYGQLGNASYLDNYVSPQQVMTNVKKAVAKSEFSIVLKTDGSVYSFGENSYGVLGIPTVTKKNTPSYVLNNIKDISAGYGHVLALSMDGLVYSWGDNSSNQLGDGSDGSRSQPTVVFSDATKIFASSFSSYVSYIDDSLWGWGSTSFETSSLLYPKMLSDRVTTIAADYGQSFVIYNDGSLGVIGSGNTYGYLGIGVTGYNTSFAFASNVKKFIAASSRDTRYWLTNDGELYGFGSNWDGELGDALLATHYTPTLIMDGVKDFEISEYDEWYGSQLSVYAIRNDNSLWVFGQNKHGQLGVGTTSSVYAPTKILDNVLSIESNSRSTFAIKTDGSLASWGENGSGQLGDGTTSARYSPLTILNNVNQVAMGEAYILALKNDGNIWAWGNNYSGAFGNGNSTDSLVPIQVGSGFKFVSASGYASFGITTGNTLMAWGLDENDKLGNGSQTYTSVPVAILNDISSLHTGQYSMGAIKLDGTAWVWGSNGSTNLGVGNNLPVISPTQVLTNVKSIKFESPYTVFITNANELYAAGSSSTVFGSGFPTTLYVPTKLNSSATEATTSYYHLFYKSIEGEYFGTNAYGELLNRQIILINSSGKYLYGSNITSDQKLTHSFILTKPSLLSSNLTWDAVVGADGYEIHRSISPTGPFTLRSTVTVPTYSESGLTFNTKYYYKYRPFTLVNSVKNYGSYSEAKFIYTHKPFIGDPTNLQYTLPVYDEVKLTWNAVAGAENYKIYRSNNGPSTLVGTVTTTSFSDTNVTFDTTYSYVVKATKMVDGVEVVNDGSPSVTVLVATPVPSKPTNFTVENDGYLNAILSWEASIYTKFEIYRSSVDESDIFLATTTNLEYTDMDALENVAYTYYIKPILVYKDISYPGPISDTKEITLVDLLPAPSYIYADENGVDSNYIMWSYSETTLNQYDYYYFEIYASNAFDGDYYYIGESYSDIFWDEYLNIGQEYFYKVRFVGYIDADPYYSSFSEVVSATPKPATPYVEAKSEAYNGIRISWYSYEDNTGYQVYRGFNETGSYAIIATVDGSTYSYLNSPLTTNRSYFYKVRAYLVVDGITYYSDYTSVVSAKPIPAAPASIDVVAVNSSSMNITWATVEGATGYQLFRSFGPTGTFTLAASTTTNSYLNTGLTLNRTYFYRVRAYTMVGTTRVVGPYSTVDSAKPIPAAPINVIAASGGYDRINLSWTPAIGAGGYTIYRATSLTGSYSIVGNVTTNSFQNVGLGFNTTYYYKVRSFYMINDVKNYGLMSEPVSGKTALSTPTVSSSNLSTTSIKLTWEAISGASGYEVYRSTTSNGTYALQGTVTTNTYSKTGLVKGTVYYYKVRAYRLVGTTKVYGEFSSPKYLKVGY